MPTSPPVKPRTSRAHSCCDRSMRARPIRRLVKRPDGDTGPVRQLPHFHLGRTRLHVERSAASDGVVYNLTLREDQPSRSEAATWASERAPKNVGRLPQCDVCQQAYAQHEVVPLPELDVAASFLWVGEPLETEIERRTRADIVAEAECTTVRRQALHGALRLIDGLLVMAGCAYPARGRYRGRTRTPSLRLSASFAKATNPQSASSGGVRAGQTNPQMPTCQCRPGARRRPGLAIRPSPPGARVSADA